MYSLNPSTAATKRKRTTPNLLPCAIHHNGPVPTSLRYWSPSTTISANGVQTKISYFRGRKLHGRKLRLPAGYTGLVLQKTANAVPVKPKIPTAEELRAMEEGMDEIDGLDECGKLEEMEVRGLNVQAEFEELVVWGHEMVPDGDDEYVRGMKEWIGFAEAMHCDDKSTKADTTNVA